MAKIQDLILPSKKGYTVKKVSDNMTRKDFESGFPDGVYGWPSKPGEPRLKVKKLLTYCRKHGIAPNDLSEEDRKQFYSYD
ncbi:hypothetical protein LCY76_23620 [Fictibacillus sp. KIGAM418]|uniref:Uncharacterized protein n=1 Tax=Fictibacillus marinisediminis TaxID=2878389 RepID=A0A9X1XEQ6_9BACL|nr:hypothetical protein [Fictibacillus marinisediminis]MCK6259562.1 hypothetical protein [Fictibacillus marinisediminis]